MEGAEYAGGAEDVDSADLCPRRGRQREAEQSHGRYGDRARHGEYVTPRGDAGKAARDKK